MSGVVQSNKNKEVAVAEGGSETCLRTRGTNPSAIRKEMLQAAHKHRSNEPERAQKQVVHEVKKGETLTGIARRYDTTAIAIAKANGLKDLDRISIGQDLKIPEAHVRTGSGGRGHEPRKEAERGRSHARKEDTPHTTLSEFEKDVRGTPYKTPAPFCRVDPGRDHKTYDCLTLVLKYLGEKGVQFEAGRTDAGHKVLKDHLEPYAHVRLSNDHKRLVCTDQKTGDQVCRGAIKEGDIVLIGHPYKQAEGEFSVYHLGIVKYERDNRGEVKKGADGEPLLYMIHANSTGRYGQDREVTQTGIRSYLAQRASDTSRSAETRSHYADILVCRIRPESLPKRSHGALA